MLNAAIIFAILAILCHAVFFIAAVVTRDDFWEDVQWISFTWFAFLFFVAYVLWLSGVEFTTIFRA